MCGIAGIIGLQSNNQQKMEAMLQKQQHRGPDAQAIWKENAIILGHNRLSIIDLATTANQPMLSICGTFVIVFNGEIYNYLTLKSELKNDYTFQTNSDTEVLLAAYSKWGKDMLSKLNGMFSFAIWNRKEQSLFAARDRFGVKPFYYTIFENQFYFASEIKTLFAAAIPKRNNKKVWANYYSFGTYGLPNETFFENINQLPAGHFFEMQFSNSYENTSIKIEKWYDFSNRILEQETVASNNIEEMYSDLLQDAIRLRFIADVPLGMNVSGGLDSSTLIGLIHQNLPKNKAIEAFTFYCNDANYDELPWVNEIMKTTPFNLNKVLLEVKAIPDLIKKVAYYQDEPFGGFPTIAYSLLFEAARSKGIKVILDGQGMDEAWAGYDYYHNESNQIIQGIQSSPVRTTAINKDFLLHAEKEIYETPFQSKLQNLQFRDLFYTKIPRALRFNDRISMMHSTELREPFLDYRLVEFAFGQADDLKVKNGQSKWLLRDLAKKTLGNNLAMAPKRALQTPQREWIANDLLAYCDEQINKFSNLDFVNKQEVQKIWQEYKNGNQDNSFYIWQWINTVN